MCQANLSQRAQQQLQQQQRNFAASFRPTAQQIRNAMAPVQFGGFNPGKFQARGFTPQSAPKRPNRNIFHPLASKHRFLSTVEVQLFKDVNEISLRSRL